ncbi:Phosphatidylethanolamine-binding protein PEBP [Penicillium robsamsonii]|uniref:Phosphatidylethanolamine-binding protein PEBP n=1 Tax=Penicillium robsamsonii TaxID=1792511 RepID=UPI00254775B1|nr:Phosphatidylethanolamine-binding protein PEBP [Penicillium robsamsonii]KAJ5817394.1 Phosphatidylethanolamine-binding protein PEBP [Penicillium robsamsonii]
MAPDTEIPSGARTANNLYPQRWGNLALMIPPLIYGVTTRENRLSIELPTHIRYSLKHGNAGQIGKGLAVWNQIHVKDLARGYMVLLHWMERAPVTEIVENPYFCCENGQELSSGWAPLEKETFASLAEDEISTIAKETGEFTGYASVVASLLGAEHPTAVILSLK